MHFTMTSYNSDRDPLISICVPTYNREGLLLRLLDSIGDDVPNLELVIVDDGSTDNTKTLVEQRKNCVAWKIVYLYQPNAGRADALKRAILASSGTYIMLMDSDDYFVDNWWEILTHSLEQYKEELVSQSLSGLVFNTVDEKGGLIGSMFPSSPLVSNLIEIRADYKVSGDKKEIIKSHILKSCLYENKSRERRVPTALIWAKVANQTNCLFINESIVVKSYQKEGLTKNLRELKIKNPFSMMELNFLLYSSSAYKSKVYRVKAGIQLSRYALHSKQKVNCGYVFRFFGLFFYLIDKIYIYFKG